MKREQPINTGRNRTPGQGLEPQSPGPEPGVTANWTIPDSVWAREYPTGERIRSERRGMPVGREVGGDCLLQARVQHQQHLIAGLDHRVVLGHEP